MDRFTEYSSRSLGDNIGRSLKGMLGGLVLIVVAFPVLWKNEGRTDLSSIAKAATVVASDGKSAPPSGTLVAVTDLLTADAPIGDEPYLRPGAYVTLDRRPEMYAWVEHVETKRKKKLGGGTTEARTYSYEREWTASPASGADFRVPDGHRNPVATVARASRSADVAMIGAYGLDPSDAGLPAARPLTLRPELLTRNAGTIIDGALYLRGARPATPRLGDERITWSARPTGEQVTAYGAVMGHMLQPFEKNGDRLFRVLPGTHAQAVAQLHGEHVMVGWVLRFVGFFCLWIGMSLVLGPINAVLDVVPFVGSTGRFVTSVALLPIALGITIVVVFASIVAHNPLVMIPLILAVTAGGYYGFKRAALKKAARTGRL